MNSKYIIFSETEIFIEEAGKEFVKFNGEGITGFDVVRNTPGFLSFRTGNKVYNFTWYEKDKNVFGIYLNGKYFECSLQSKTERLAQELTGRQKETETTREVKSPMPGLVVKIKAGLGQSIGVGETVLILEAMKMENDIKSPVSGILKSIFVKEGLAIEKGTSLFTIEK